MLFGKFFKQRYFEEINYFENRKFQHIQDIRKVLDEICLYESKRFKTLDIYYESNKPHYILIDIALTQKITNILFWSRSFRYIFLREKLRGKKIVFPLKPSWIHILKEKNIRVSTTFSILAFVLFCFLYFFYELWEVVHTIENPKTISVSVLEVIYVDELSKFQITNDTNSYTFIRWIKDKLYPNQNTIFLHSNKSLNEDSGLNSKDLFYSSKIIDYLTLNERLSLFSKIFKFAIKNLNYKLFMGLPSIYKYFKILYFPNKILAKEFIFNCSRGSNMPLWVHGLVQQKKRVIYVFYALYTEPSYVNKSTAETELWKLSTWPKIICIDEIQKEEIFRASTLVKIDFQYLGVPWWIDCNEVLPNNLDPYVAVFDTYTSKGGFSLSVLNEYKLDLLSKMREYLENIIQVSVANGYNIVIKFKRNSFRINSQQDYFINELQKRYPNRIFYADANISPIRVIENAGLVICKPLSTIGFIAKEKGIKAIQYSVSEFQISDNYHSKRNIPLAQSIDELRNYFIDMRN